MNTVAIAPKAPVPKIGFVSLGCPKALTDSELILTQLAAEGYQTSKTFAGADLVIVNTCGFIDDAVKESLDTIGEALAENGKVIVTGCLGARGDMVQQAHPKVLAKLLRVCFQQRRKQLGGVFRRSGLPGLEVALEKTGLDPSLRPEALANKDFQALAAFWAEQLDNNA